MKTIVETVGTVLLIIGLSNYQSILCLIKLNKHYLMPVRKISAYL